MVQVLPDKLTGTQHVLTEKGAHLLYLGSAETPVRLRLIEKEQIRPGESGFARLFMRDALPVGRGDRFVLRDAGRILTFGGGYVLDPRPSRRPKVDLLERLVTATPEEALRAFVQAEGALSVNDALGRSGARTSIDSGITQLDSIFVSQEHLEKLLALMQNKVHAYHDSHPLERGIPKEVLRADTGLNLSAFERLLAEHPAVVGDGTVVRSREHSNALPPAQQRARDAIMSRVEAAGMTPPSSKDLEADAGLLRALVEAEDLVRIGDFHITGNQARSIRTKVREAIQLSGPLTVAQIRDLLGTSRKYAVPICEWLDATAATRRQGDLRDLGPRP
jgi:selenocysteine-specific elongation factor